MYIDKNYLVIKDNNKELTRVDLDKWKSDFKYCLANMNKEYRFYIRKQKFFARYFELKNGMIEYTFNYNKVLLSDNIIKELKEYYDINYPSILPLILILIAFVLFVVLVIEIAYILDYFIF